MSSSSPLFRASSAVAIGEESADETTCLLPKQADKSTSCNGHATKPAKISKIFGLWQIGALCGILLAYADTSLVWATHETIASRFDSRQKSSWMMTSFTIGYCVTLPLYGRLSDNFGSLRSLLVAYCTFCIGSALCGIGLAYWQVILGRIIAGCGASGIVSLASIIITEHADPPDVVVLRSYVNIASTIGLSGGGPLGGFLAEVIGWRWLFLGQVPIAAACCLLIAQSLTVTLPKLEREEEQQRDDSRNEPAPALLAFDFPGAITLAIAISSLLAAIDLQNPLAWGHPLVLSLLIVGILSTLAFLAFETFPGNRELLMPLRLLKTEIGAFCAGQLLIVASGYGFVSQIAPYFANTQGASDAEGGGRTVPFSIGNAVVVILLRWPYPIAGTRITGRKFPFWAEAGLRKQLQIEANDYMKLVAGVWEEILTTFPFGLFGGIVLSAQFIGLYNCSPNQYMATAISMYYMSQQIGIALGISISSGLLKHQFKVTLQNAMVNVPGYTEVSPIRHLARKEKKRKKSNLYNQQIIKRILDDSSVVALFPEEIQSLIRQSYLNSFWVVPVLAVSTQVLTILPMIFTTEKYSNRLVKACQ
ncbi:Uncharacterized protein BP5553_06741 [Venustampulla echinocandica]|uniref:Major facilitator superfamily (MFS) profile domain-containing protein n=1 Tax=Venustampulla echinocandica TaxID=2656787 RepID=A0A370TKT7_9HELO|nr:Uncharacterized protein BP5553_06741 [Venustampulla echinocandica]RDL36129.1 Uncharacterized protein BP5553_06741 [Venustampulla echinocandica]